MKKIVKTDTENSDIYALLNKIEILEKKSKNNFFLFPLKKKHECPRKKFLSRLYKYCSKC